MLKPYFVRGYKPEHFGLFMARDEYHLFNMLDETLNPYSMEYHRIPAHVDCGFGFVFKKQVRNNQVVTLKQETTLTVANAFDWVQNSNEWKKFKNKHGGYRDES